MSGLCGEMDDPVFGGCYGRWCCRPAGHDGSHSDTLLPQEPPARTTAAAPAPAPVLVSVIPVVAAPAAAASAVPQPGQGLAALWAGLPRAWMRRPM